MGWYKSFMGVSDSKFTIRVLAECKYQRVQITKFLGIGFGFAFLFCLRLATHVLEIIAPTIFLVAHFIFLINYNKLKNKK